MYEIHQLKKKIKQDIPIQLGFFILNYAKVQMIQFYHHVTVR